MRDRLDLVIFAIVIAAIIFAKTSDGEAVDKVLNLVLRSRMSALDDIIQKEAERWNSDSRQGHTQEGQK